MMRDLPPGEDAHARLVAVGTWLLSVCGLVFAMVVIGALTRLTHSGLSMVDWRPVTGWLPPLTDDAWQMAFARYQAYPEFQKVNVDMTLAGYKSIFWLEYLHRLLGRVIGVVFTIPLVVFWLQNRLSRRLKFHGTLLLLLGGAQGGVGWFMVKSGLVDRPDVSQYRLALHLMVAFAIYAYAFWLALDCLWPRVRNVHTLDERRSFLRHIGVVTMLAVVTILSGAFVAGLDAGRVLNDFPWMGGRLIPAGLVAYQPWYKNFFENVVTVQFQHRLLAVSTGVAVLHLAWRILRVASRDVPGKSHRTARFLIVVVLAQITLGILTLRLFVPTTLATLHQTGGLLLLTGLVWAAHEMRRAVHAAA
jgi:cytochrome c oxidase assembly protein subunit 15